MTPTAKFLVFTMLIVGAATAASAQATKGKINSPVAQVRDNRSWEFAPFAFYGNGIGGDRSNYWFFSVGVEAGKLLTPPLHAGILSGQFEYGSEHYAILAGVHTPPHVQTFVSAAVYV